MVGVDPVSRFQSPGTRTRIVVGGRKYRGTGPKVPYVWDLLRVTYTPDRVSTLKPVEGTLPSVVSDRSTLVLDGRRTIKG